MMIFDTESDGLLDEATRIWVFGWTLDGEVFNTTSDYDFIREVLDSQEQSGCHNSIRYDFPLFEKILGYRYMGLKIDTLALSWYLYPNRLKHGLSDWGQEVGIEKVYVDPDSWVNLDMDLAIRRVTEDVKINWKLWRKQKRDLEKLYDS